jgi:hypothetical protein
MAWQPRLPGKQFTPLAILQSKRLLAFGGDEALFKRKDNSLS